MSTVVLTGWRSCFLDSWIIITLHPQIIYWGTVFLLGLDVVNATDSTAENHGEDHGQDLNQDDGCDDS